MTYRDNWKSDISIQTLKVYSLLHWYEKVVFSHIGYNNTTAVLFDRRVYKYNI